MKVIIALLISLLLANCVIEDDRLTPGSFRPPIDVEGYEYPTIQIGGQIWMAENLKTTKYRNGDEIETTLFLHEDIREASNPKFQWPYQGNDNYIQDYGRLYTWYATMDPREVCPEGWKIPSNDDWMILANYLGDEDVAGDALKETGITHWHPPNEGATNETGFTAIPAGYRKAIGEFGAIGYRARWWSSTDSPPDHAWRFGVDYDSEGISFNDRYTKAGAYSVRCMRYE